jgi:Carboxypeptidase regulatory-like domain
MTQPSKSRYGIAVVGLVVLAGVGWVILRDAGVLSPPERAATTQEEVASPNAPITAPPVARESATPAEPEIIESLSGRVIDAATGAPLAADLDLVRELPPFIEVDPIAGVSQRSSAPEDAVIVRRTVNTDGTFQLDGARLVGYLVPKDRFLVQRDAIYVDAREATTSRTIRLDRAGVVKGIVRGPDGAPFAAAKVKLQSKVGIDVAFQRTPIRRECATTSDDAGQFTIEHVPAGMPFDLAIESEGVLKQWRKVEVSAGATLEVDVTLSAGDTLAGRVRRENGEPVEGALVVATEATLRVDPQAPQRADVGELRATTNAAGGFEIRGVLAGRYTLRADHPDYARASHKDISVPQGGLVIADDLVLTGGERISGRIVDAADQGVGEAELGLRKTTAFAANGLGLAPDSAEQMGGHRFFCAADGSFRSPPLAPGEYDVVAVKKGYTQALATGVRAGAGDIVLRLGARGAIEGTVIAFETAEPVVEFHVAALRPFDFAKLMDPATFEPIRHAAVLSAKGRYRIDDLGAGEYDVTIAAPSLARATQKVTVKAGETVKSVNFFMRPEAVLAGTVTERATG